MTIKRHGVGDAKGNGQKALPFAKATRRTAGSTYRARPR